MFQPKLIVTDLDGTALKNNKTISNATVEAFTQCRKYGIPSAIATARYLGDAMPFAKKTAHRVPNPHRRHLGL